VRGATGARDDGAQPARTRRLGVLEHGIGRAVRRDDLGFVWHVELGERIARFAHHLPVAL
jgi:hypothetical protein